jgi:DNA-directed RNA polymerase subunit RPC12/RpoP
MNNAGYEYLAIARVPMPSSVTHVREGRMKETRKVHYVKGVFVCPKCRQSYVQEKWIEEWRVRCHKCDYRGTLTEVSVEERMEEEIVRR